MIWVRQIGQQGQLMNFRDWNPWPLLPVSSLKISAKMPIELRASSLLFPANPMLQVSATYPIYNRDLDICHFLWIDFFRNIGPFTRLSTYGWLKLGLAFLVACERFTTALYPKLVVSLSFCCVSVFASISFCFWCLAQLTIFIHWICPAFFLGVTWFFEQIVETVFSFIYN